MTKKYNYGTEIVEFYKHDDIELQELVKAKEVFYFKHCMSPAYPELGVHVDWHSDKPLALALQELTDWMLKGYIVASALGRPLYLKLQLKKPQSMIDGDLIEIAEQAEAEYTASRYERNVQETARQIEITVARQVREAEAKAAKAAADLLATAQHGALADLLAAYATPKAKAKKMDEDVRA
jgi:hypothetical protein